jgi:hypothetical protein
MMQTKRTQNCIESPRYRNSDNAPDAGIPASPMGIPIDLEAGDFSGFKPLNPTDPTVAEIPVTPAAVEPEAAQAEDSAPLTPRPSRASLPSKSLLSCGG